MSWGSRHGTRVLTHPLKYGGSISSWISWFHMFLWVFLGLALWWEYDGIFMDLVKNPADIRIFSPDSDFLPAKLADLTIKYGFWPPKLRKSLRNDCWLLPNDISIGFRHVCKCIKGVSNCLIGYYQRKMMLEEEQCDLRQAIYLV